MRRAQLFLSRARPPLNAFGAQVNPSIKYIGFVINSCECASPLGSTASRADESTQSLPTPPRARSARASESSQLL